MSGWLRTRFFRRRENRARTKRYVEVDGASQSGNAVLDVGAIGKRNGVQLLDAGTVFHPAEQIFAFVRIVVLVEISFVTLDLLAVADAVRHGRRILALR